MIRFLKLLGQVILSVVLVYSGAASAFLKCSHERADSFEEVSSDDGAEIPDAPEIECVQPDYQIGPVIVSSSPPRVFTDGVLLPISSEAGTLSDSKIVLRGVFLELFPSYSFLDGSARYLFLSIFRI